ncbi:uncharacterized protein LOC123304708, partial [Chrysoperla carnea]|uniref:uncharacterized protein LOC123304708 n=1 Tax=Chrysoperla carnea TaxID=189513 RepID=UPI001D06F211
MAEAKLKSKLKVLTSKKQTLFKRVQLLFDKSQNIADETIVNDFLIRYSTLNETCNEFKLLVDDINLINLELDPEFEPNCQELNVIDELFCHIKSVADSLKVKKSEQVNESVKSIGDIVSPRLPKITIPSFDGNPLRWPIFYATFKSLVHENIKLDSISKLHYLLGSLTHNALALCSGVPPTPENYSIMWDSLIDKYEDSRQIAFMYLDQILKFKPFLVESGQNLNLFVEKFDSAVNALKEVKVGELSDFILMTIALQKLDVHTQKLFEQSLAKGVIPTYNELSIFIKTQAKILSRTSGSANSSKQANSKAVMHSFAISADSNSSDVMSNNTYEKLICPKCKGNHKLFKCHKFMSLTPTERVHVVKAHNLCFNCLHSNHGVKNCSSNSSCRKCSKRHHTLLHFHHKSDANGKDNSEVLKGNPSTSSVSVESKPSPPVSLCSTSELLQSKYTVLLATAQVHVVSHFGENFLFRFLIDSASQCNFITQRCCQRLKLPVNRACLTVSGIGVSEKRVNGQAQLKFYSKYDIHNKYTMDVLIVDKITDQLPTCVIDSEVCDTFKNLRLADDEFYRPSEIDGMIGAELVPYILKGLRITGPDSPVALDSTLGFIIMGKAKAEVTNNIIQSYCCVNSPLNMDQLIQQFWDIEEVPNGTVLNADDLECEKLFAASVKRDVSGRYEVALPFKNIFSDLGDSYTSALRRFQNLEKRFASMPLFKKQYMEVIRDYFDQGHLKTISGLHPKSCGYFIPHHGVFKASSSSTPLRVVFDASAKTDNGISLNDALYTGPKLQTDIFDILLNFRLFQFAMTSDVKQMYRQIELCPPHRKYQCILWRFSDEEPIQICQLTTVAFGVKSSPYLALRTLRQLAVDEAKKFPLASEIILRDIYIDDIICSVAEKSIAHNIYRELVGLFRAGGMELVKWATNLRELSDEIPDHARSNQILEFPTEFLKVLGLQWQANSDVLSFSISVENLECTKRNILKTVMRIWDPLGLLVPVSLHMKLLIQELWLLKLGWDEPIPNYLQNIWKAFQNELNDLSQIKIPRHIGFKTGSSLELLAFCDASSKAYAAVIYSRIIDPDRHLQLHILCAKSKVAPVKTILTIPRLELCATLLLAKLLKCVIAQYSNRVNITNVFAFSDSMVVLNWINGSPHKWKTFVANRVSKIQSLIDVSSWYHISSSDNPADCASRGLSPKEFLEHPLWLSGPSWCSRDRSEWPLKPFTKNIEQEVVSEAKTISLPVFEEEEHPLYSLINRCGSWLKLIRSTVFVLRFARILPKRENIIATDLTKAENYLISSVQRVHFREEFRLLKNDKLCSPKIRFLNPFIQDNIIRVGGRLVNAVIAYDQQHPMLLPKRDHFVDLLIDYNHRFNLHAGPHLLLSILRQKYWILAARGTVRFRVQKCNTCFKTKPRSHAPIMADLPSVRVSQAKAFTYTGVDYGGPFYITLSRHRGVRSQKAYICLFTCLTTRAVHLELASDLSTDVFLAAFKRFLSRRGPCSTIYSDSGTNFIGAKRYLNELYEFVQSNLYQSAINSELSCRRIIWRLNPPTGSHFGGAWESMIKSVKTHLTRVIGEQILSYEEFSTVLIQIEALLNSRPLVWQSSDAAEGLALTPAHFLTLTPLQSLPAYNVLDKPLNKLQRKELLDSLVQSYWKRWHQEYLGELQTRQKWNTPTCPVTPGTLVLIKNDNLPPLQWLTGVIQE